MKFKYDDKVKIKSGFYEGIIGQVRNFVKKGLFFPSVQYLIVWNGRTLWEDEDNIEKVK